MTPDEVRKLLQQRDDAETPPEKRLAELKIKLAKQREKVKKILDKGFARGDDTSPALERARDEVEDLQQKIKELKQRMGIKESLSERLLSLFESEDIKAKIKANNDKMTALHKKQDDGEDCQDEIDALEQENDELNDELEESYDNYPLYDKFQKKIEYQQKNASVLHRKMVELKHKRANTGSDDTQRASLTKEIDALASKIEKCDAKIAQLRKEQKEQVKFTSDDD